MRYFSILAALGATFLAMAPVQADEAGFSAWLVQYRQGAVQRGLSAEWIDKALADAVYTPRVVELDRAQPDDSGRRNVFASYLDRQLTPQRIADGRARASAHSSALKRISAETGVPGAIIVAIWGMETSYGRITGGFDLPSSLATLAYDGRRAELFTRELDALVRMVGEGRADRSQLRGSWAGAFGQPQFLPSSYLGYAKDGDGDGRADIWNSVPDTFASIANYLREHGWQRDIPWGFRAVVPRNFDRVSIGNPEKPESCIRPMQAHSRWRTAGEWRADGFIPMNALWPADDVPMTLVEPDGPDTGAYLTTASYRAIMEYNCSNFYALSVALLADAVQSVLRN
ncbi:MAG: lytic murein transglycosylase [Sphingomonadaceae bacterium]